jgi:hypothetical protein
MPSPCCLCFCVSVIYESPHINLWMPESVFMKLGMYIVAPDPISTAYFINLSYHSVCLWSPHIVARQRLGKHVPAAMNTRNKKEVLDGCVSGFMYPP